MRMRKAIIIGSVEKGSGSQLWETAFAMRALLASNLGVETFDVLRRRHSYIKKSLVILVHYLVLLYQTIKCF